MWNGLPSTLPLKTTDCRSLIGNSGLVISVGLENVGAVMSTRSLSGASGSLSSPAAVELGLARLRDRFGSRAGARVAPSPPPQAPSASAATRAVRCDGERLLRWRIACD